MNKPDNTYSIRRGNIGLGLIKFPDRKNYTLVYDNGKCWNCIGSVRFPELWNEALQKIFGGNVEVNTTLPEQMHDDTEDM